MNHGIENVIVFSCGGTALADQYHQMERRHGRGHDRQLINGRITGCGKCVGYCRFDEHAGFLTKELRQSHDCLGKQCRYYLSKPNVHEIAGIRQFCATS